MARDYRMKDFTITEEALKATILDADLNEIFCSFYYDGCAHIDTSKLSNVQLTRSNLIELANLIERSEDYFNKKFAMGNPSKTIIEPPIVKNNN